MWRNPHHWQLCPHFWPVLLYVRTKALCIDYLMRIISKWRCISKDVFHPHHSSNPDVHEWSVFLGQQRVNGSEEFEMSLGVVNITVSKMTGSNIALLQLAKPVSYTNYIQPVCLDISNDRSFPIGSSCWVAGWGKGSKSRGKSFPSICVCCKFCFYNVYF